MVKALFDTNILIDYLNAVPAARTELRRYNDKAISIITWMEFAEGYGDLQAEDCRLFLSHFPLLPINETIAWRASRFARHLRELGTPIGDHDVWLAATAVERDEPLVSRNLEHFRRIDGLRLIGY